MKVKVQFFAAARELVGSREEVLDVPVGFTVRALLDLLLEKHGDRLRDYLFDPKTGDLRRSIQLLVGDRSVIDLGGMTAVLSDGSVFAIIPPVGGG